MKMKRTSSHPSASLVCSKPSKQKPITPATDHDDGEDDEDCLLPSDTEAAILYIHALFPSPKFSPLPPIIFKHQIYSMIHDKTTVDRDIIGLKDSNKIRLIKIDTSQEDYAIVYSNEYNSLISHVLQSFDPLLHRKVIDKLLPHSTDHSVSKQQLTKQFKFTEEEISCLVSKGFLVMKDMVGGSSVWWYSIPGVSSFKIDFSKGQLAIVRLMRRLKYKEILQSELEKKRLSVTQLPIEYHVLYLIGCELITSIHTSAGKMLKLSE